MVKRTVEKFVFRIKAFMAGGCAQQPPPQQQHEAGGVHSSSSSSSSEGWMEGGTGGWPAEQVPVAPLAADAAAVPTRAPTPHHAEAEAGGVTFTLGQVGAVLPWRCLVAGLLSPPHMSHVPVP